MKQRKKRPGTQLICLFLAVWMLLCTTPAAALDSLLGEDAPTAPVPELEETVDETTEPAQAPTRVGELSLQELATMQVNPDHIPQVIPLAEAQERGLVNRLYAQEQSTSTVIFQRQNGEKTAYVYSRPVKYADDDGVIRDKSSAIASLLDTTYAFGMQDNSVKVYFPKNITSGIMLAYHGYSISICPEEGRSAAPTQLATDQIAYAGVFGASTILRYTTNLYGVKEDIVLVKQSAQNSYSFVIDTDGLTATQQNGIWMLCDTNGNKVMRFDPIIAKDSGNKTVTGELAMTPISGNRYRMTVTVPTEFLQASDTLYPVYIDPSTTVTEYEYRYYSDPDYGEDEGDFETIVDAAVYSDQWGYNHLNQYPSNITFGGNRLIIYKLFDFHHMYGQFKDLHPEQITNVTFYINVNELEDDMTAEIYPMTATWANSYGENPVALLDTTGNGLLSDYDCEYIVDQFDLVYDLNAIDITSLVKSWARYNQGTDLSWNPAYGFGMIEASNSGGTTYVYSTEMAGNNNVYYTIDYGAFVGEYYLVSDISGTDRARGIQLYFDSNPATNPEEDRYVRLPGLQAAGDFRWVFEYVGTNASGQSEYRIKAADDPSYQLVMQSSSIDAGGGYYQNQAIWIIESIGAKYLIQSKQYPGRYLYNNNGSLSYTTNSSLAGARWQLMSADYYIPVLDFKLKDYQIAKGESQLMRFETYPSNANYGTIPCFTWEILWGSGYTINSQGVITAASTGSPAILLEVTHRYTGEVRTFYIAETIEYMYFKLAGERAIDLFLGASSTPNGDGICELEFSGLNIEQKRYAWMVVTDFADDYLVINAETQKFLGIRANSDGKLRGVMTTVPTSWGYTTTTNDRGKYYRFFDPETGLNLRANIWTPGNEFLTLLSDTESDLGSFKCVQKQYEANIQLYYDQAFVDRYGADYLDILYGSVNVMRAKFLEAYGMWFHINTPQFYSSYADQCTSTDGDEIYNGRCTCGGDHKNKNNNMSHYNKGTDHIKLYFSGHEIYHDSNSSDSINGFAETNEATAVVCRHGDSDALALNIGRTTSHEIGHLFGAPDHYEPGQPGYETYDTYCLFGTNRNQSEFPNMCDHCYSQIKANIDKFE